MRIQMAFLLLHLFWKSLYHHMSPEFFFVDLLSCRAS